MCFKTTYQDGGQCVDEHSHSERFTLLGTQTKKKAVSS